MSLMGAAMSHAILPGAAIGYLLAGLSLFAMSAGGLIAGIVVVLRRGRVEQAASPRDLLDAPATDYVRTLLQRARVDQLAGVPS